MINTEIEYFTVQQAVDDGLCDAINRGETVVAGYYECGKDNRLKFNQQRFVFKDKNGSLRVGEFVNAASAIEFINLFTTGAI